MASFMPNGAFGGPAGTTPDATQAAPGGQTQTPPTIDLNALASYVQQFQKQNQANGSNPAPNPPGLQEALAAIMKQNQTNQSIVPPVNPIPTDPNAINKEAPKDPNAPKDTPQKDGDTTMANANDPQSLMEQISQLTKTLDEEKAKSKALQVLTEVAMIWYAMVCYGMILTWYDIKK